MTDNTARDDAEIIAEMSRQFPKPTPTYSEALAQTNPRWELQQLTTIAHMVRTPEMLAVVERIEKAAIAELRSSVLTEAAFENPEVLKMIEILERPKHEDD